MLFGQFIWTLYEAECYWAAFHPLLDAGYNSVGNDKVGRLNEICNFGVPICPIPQATQEEDNCEHCVPENLVLKVYIFTIYSQWYDSPYKSHLRVWSRAWVPNNTLNVKVNVAPCHGNVEALVTHDTRITQTVYEEGMTEQVKVLQLLENILHDVRDLIRVTKQVPLCRIELVLLRVELCTPALTLGVSGVHELCWQNLIWI